MTCAHTKLLLAPLPFVGKVQIRMSPEGFTASKLLGKALGAPEPPMLGEV